MQINAIVKFRSKRYVAKSLDKNFDPHNFGRGGGGGGRRAKICLAMSSNQVTDV